MEKNKTNVIIIAIIVMIALGAYFIGSMTKKHKKVPRSAGNVNIEKIFSSLDESVAPEGLPDITGQFIAVDGDQVIIERVVGEMKNTERSKTRASMQSLSDGGREQMREARRAEREVAEKEKIFVTISDKTIVMKSTDSDELEKINIQDLNEDKNVMIWKDGSGAIFILQNNAMRNNKL